MIHAADPVAAQAHADLVTAYGVIAGEASPPANDLTGTDLGGLILTPGVYHFDTSAALTGILTLNAQGNPNARFDFQIGTTLITASNSAIQIINGGNADNVYFQVGSSATLGTATAFEGNILADQSVTLTTGASIQDGRALALVGAVTMDTNHISIPPSDVVGITAADLSLTKTTAAGTVLAGDTISYTITVSNAGPSDAQTVAMTDAVPANTTFVSDVQTSGPAFTITNPAVGGTGTISDTIGTLADGRSASFTVVLLVLPSTPDGATIANTAAVAAATFDPNLLNNSQTVTTDVVTSADLSLTKTTTAGPVLAGDTISYTITVSNAGPSDAQTVAMTDAVPANTTFVSDCADQWTGVHNHQSRCGRHGHDQRHDRHAGRRHVGELYRSAPGVAEHPGRCDDRQHGGSGRRHLRSQPRQQQPDGHEQRGSACHAPVTHACHAPVTHDCKIGTFWLPRPTDDSGDLV